MSQDVDSLINWGASASSPAVAMTGMPSETLAQDVEFADGRQAVQGERPQGMEDARGTETAADSSKDDDDPEWIEPVAAQGDPQWEPSDGKEEEPAQGSPTDEDGEADDENGEDGDGPGGQPDTVDEAKDPESDDDSGDQDGSGDEDPANPGDPNDPTNPADPSDPNNPTDPDDPNDPSDPNNPEDPNNPTDPNNPGDPNNPTDPNNPGDPNDPTDPNDPSDPSDPTTPDPTDPGSPGGPGTPDPTDPGDDGKPGDQPDLPDVPDVPAPGTEPPADADKPGDSGEPTTPGADLPSVPSGGGGGGPSGGGSGTGGPTGTGGPGGGGQNGPTGNNGDQNKGDTGKKQTPKEIRDQYLSAEGVSSEWRNARPETLKSFGNKIEHDVAKDLDALTSEIKQISTGFPGFGLLGLPITFAHGSVRDTAAGYVDAAHQSVKGWNNQLHNGAKIIESAEAASTAKS